MKEFTPEELATYYDMRANKPELFRGELSASPDEEPLEDDDVTEILDDDDEDDDDESDITEELDDEDDEEDKD